jgi:hypothetical protein
MDVMAAHEEAALFFDDQRTQPGRSGFLGGRRKCQGHGDPCRMENRRAPSPAADPYPIV